MTDPQFLFVVEYPCEGHCRVEVDVNGENPRATVAMLVKAADQEHKRTCRPQVATPTFRTMFQ